MCVCETPMSPPILCTVLCLNSVPPDDDPRIITRPICRVSSTHDVYRFGILVRPDRLRAEFPAETARLDAAKR